MNWLDYLIIVIYSAGLLSLGFFFKNQKDKTDFFLGGRSFGWFAMGMSTMASQLSAISFISAAAFVGMKTNGSMQWLTFELAVPLAMIFLIVVLIPPLYKAGIVSIYAYLEKRFDASTRTLISSVFQFSRAFATGIMIYTVALVLSAVMGIPEWQTILVSGLITIIYSFQGGMKAVVWGDVIQMSILVIGIVICTLYGLKLLGGWDAFLAAADTSRTRVIDFNWGIGEGADFGFWPMIIGGFFLYASYYGCDQSQAQRSLSGKSLKETQRALLFNGLFRFPVTLCYCLMGLILGTFAMTNPEFMGMIPTDKPDQMVPIFILNYLPNGIIGLLLVAILAAAMSSLSSAINSLSAATLEDLIGRFRKEPLSDDQQLSYSKWLTLLWGAVCIILAFSAGQIADTVIEAINKVGSAFYGPILATFLLAILSKKAHARAVNIGLLAGVGLNMYIWLAGIPIFWIWWNFIGTAVTLFVGYGLSLIIPPKGEIKALLETPQLKFARLENYILLAFFGFMVWFSLSLPGWL
ncbi:MAG: sodium:solute symporter [Saprospiraceae bacterium]|nr:sodium:solute symporter [Saprospiraceae bacterium]